MRKYFIHDGQKEKGPFDLEELKKEKIENDTPIWYDGLQKWTTVGEVNELKVLIGSYLTPPPLKQDIKTPPPIITNKINDSTQNSTFILTKKKLIVYFIIAALLIIGGIISWLIYQNKTHSENLNNVKQQVSQQQIEQLQKEQEEILRQQKEQIEKDRANKQLTEKNMNYRNNWKKYVTVTYNDYNSSDLGGISNLAIIIYNETDKLIDEIQVRIDYIKANGGIYKSETISVTNIGPSSTKSVYAPNSNRGISVNLEIENITAKSFNFCYPYGMRGNQNFDPYFCK